MATLAANEFKSEPSRFRANWKQTWKQYLEAGYAIDPVEQIGTLLPVLSVLPQILCFQQVISITFKYVS